MAQHLTLSGWLSVEVTDDGDNSTVTLADGAGQSVDISVNAPGGIAVDLACASTSTSAPPVATGLVITSSPSPSQGA